MAENNQTPNSKIFSSDDPLDVNDLAALDEEISNDLIEKLQNKISTQSNIRNDGDLFEEPNTEITSQIAETTTSSTDEANTAPIDNTNTNLADNNLKDENLATAEGINIGFNSDIDDNFIKKYKAKLNKKNTKEEDDDEAYSKSHSKPEEQEEIVPDDIKSRSKNNKENDIETVSGGNIVEKPITDDYLEYKDSLDYIDGNVKYSKYVVYIDPENRDFMDSLTVKERKNLINRIIKEQDSITVTKRNINKMQTIIVHIIIAILTITIAIPCIYWAINASLEATINNYRSSQSAFEQLYKDYGKIKTKP